LLVACDGFIEDLTAGFSPVHALASDLGLTPMTLDLLICISSGPVTGIAVIESASARQFFLQRGNSSSGIVNLCDFPASMTNSRRLFFPMPLEIAQRK
jgi:hypothetical protein